MGGIKWVSIQSCTFHLFTEDYVTYLVVTLTVRFSPTDARVEMLIHIIRNRGNRGMGYPSQVFSRMFWMLFKDRTAATFCHIVCIPVRRWRWTNPPPPPSRYSKTTGLNSELCLYRFN